VTKVHTGTLLRHTSWCPTATTTVRGGHGCLVVQAAAVLREVNEGGEETVAASRGRAMRL
jgi:hypothetical protein